MPRRFGDRDSDRCCESALGDIQTHVNDAVDIWLRHWAGEYQHTIAARYDVSQGRVNASGRRHAAEQRDELAPFHCPMPPVLGPRATTARLQVDTVTSGTRH